MNPTTLSLLMMTTALALAMPAQAELTILDEQEEPEDPELYMPLALCKDNPVYINDVPLCHEPHGSQADCNGVNIFVLTENECQSDDANGCNGYNVFVLSEGNCEGAYGHDGCEGVNVNLGTDNCNTAGKLLEFLKRLA